MPNTGDGVPPLTARFGLMTPEDAAASPARSARSSAGHQEEREDHEIHESMDDPRPSEPPRVHHALAPQEAGEPGHDDARRARWVAEPMAQTEAGRRNPERLGSAHDGNQSGKENRAEPKLLLGG